MPTTKSAKKRLLQSEARRARNRSAKAALRTQLRKALEAVKAKDVAKAEDEFRTLAKKLDRAASRKIIHANRAARLKSRLRHKIKALTPAAA